jgi:hypothetical protein
LFPPFFFGFLDRVGFFGHGYWGKKRQETRGKSQDARDKKQETRCKRHEAIAKRNMA